MLKININISNKENALKDAIVQAVIELMKQQNEFKLTVSVQQAAGVLGVNHLKIYELCRSDNDFPCLKMGKRIVIPVIQFLEWIDKESWGSSNKDV